MEESAASLLIGKIAAFIENEASSIAAVRDEVDDLKDELGSMESFLIDAGGKEAQTEGQKKRVTEVRNLTCQAEIVIDEFLYHIHDKQSATPFAKWLYKTIYFPKNLWYRHQIAKKLHKITKKIKALPERNERYGVHTSEATSLDSIRRVVKDKGEYSLYIKEDEPIGIEDKKQALMGLLMNGEENEMVVSVVGMGGSGKTTLVANTFNNENVKRHFDCYAWITVSQTYVIEDLFKKMIKKFHQGRKEVVPDHLNSMTHEELLEMLSTYLQSKRYLVVLDDVWDFELWKEISIPLLTRLHGSRIMLTTRNKDIASKITASSGVESRPLEIEPLGNNEDWELFSKKAFSTYDNKSCPPGLESLARKLVEKCEGLPLALVTLGCVLACKRSYSEWRRVYDSLNWHLTNDRKLMSNILLLSFNNLPNQLKPCFLYCALFPEDYLIKRKKLIRLWIAEGFVVPIDRLTPEEVAEGYLMELIDRSMLQVEERNEAGRPKACKMHDLMRELALSTSKEEMFGATYVGREIVDKDKAKIRRLSIQTTKREIYSCTDMSQLRSFLVFDELKKLPSGFKLLRVLDLENAPIDRFPVELVYLFSLRYLNLRGTLIEELPESIGRLRNLQTLNIRDSKIKVLPKAISRLLNLRHLIMYRYTGDWEGFRYVNGTKAASDLSKLQNLQVLSCVESEGNIIKAVGNMTQLTRIGITNVKASDEKDLCDSLQKLVLLHYLFLMASDEEEFLRVNELCEPPPELRMVILVGKLERVPLWFVSLDNLTNMYLHWSRLEEDLLPHVQALPNLGRLTLLNAYVGERLCFSRGFKKLKHLELYNFPLLNSIAIKKGAMPNLQSLDIEDCMELKTLPQGIEFLANVERLNLASAPVQLIESIKGGMDHPKVQHIPEINLYYERENMWCHERLSGIHSGIRIKPQKHLL